MKQEALEKTAEEKYFDEAGQLLEKEKAPEFDKEESSENERKIVLEIGKTQSGIEYEKGIKIKKE